MVWSHTSTHLPGPHARAVAYSTKIHTVRPSSRSPRMSLFRSTSLFAALTLFTLGAACSTTQAPKPAEDTAKLRSAKDVATKTGELTRAEYKDGDAEIVNYGSSDDGREHKRKRERADASGPGRITVYAKPPGEIILDGEPTGQMTPETIEAPSGQHTIQVKFEDKLSGEKQIDVRGGARLKLYFNVDHSDSPPASQPATTPRQEAPDAP